MKLCLLLMPTALTDLPGYQGNPRVFAHDHVRDLAEGAAGDGGALLAAVSQRDRSRRYSTTCIGTVGTIDNTTDA